MSKIKTKRLPPTRVSDRLYEETVKAAEIAQKNLSEYVRDAVVEMNKKVSPEN